MWCGGDGGGGEGERGSITPPHEQPLSIFRGIISLSGRQGGCCCYAWLGLSHGCRESTHGYAARLVTIYNCSLGVLAGVSVF